MSHRPQTQSVEDWIRDGRIEAYPIPSEDGSMSDISTSKAATPVPRPKTSNESKEK